MQLEFSFIHAYKYKEDIKKLKAQEAENGRTIQKLKHELIVGDQVSTAN